MTDCSWPGSDPQYINYHDHCWGMPVLDCQELFAKLCLDGQQAGLSWLIILRKQSEYERLFAQFDPHKLALFDESIIESLLQEPGIIRNRLKINAIIQNAKAYLALEQQGINFSDYLWAFVDHYPINHRLSSQAEAPTTSKEAQNMAKSLKKNGFKFVGETICYAFMQAVGMVNDHLISCSAHQRCLDRTVELFGSRTC
ncbi:MAG: DNA-3-methyladenine glycosylase 1 [Candidatus Celerinatantimonas neptuna]|nr:MAG: DNA-3-methyladenine glycosylase 1 [Candidatus Celerinatantimonas neptuna]